MCSAKISEFVLAEPAVHIDQVVNEAPENRKTEQVKSLPERQGGPGEPVFVSIIVPAHNEEQRLGPCLDALLNLDYPAAKYEIIVINNDSSDHTAEVAGRYAIRCIDASPLGVSRARNAGIMAARGNIIAFVDADCVPQRRWLKELLQGIEDEEIGCFAGEFRPLDPFTSLVEEYVHDRKMIHQGTLLQYSPAVVATGNAAYRKNVFATIGVFDEVLHAGEDADLALRMQKYSSYRIRYNPSAVVFHAHPGSVRHLVRRSYRIGKAITALRSKHSEDFAEQVFSERHRAWELLKTIAGTGILPFRVASAFQGGHTLKKSVLYPIFDKFHSISQSLGMWVEQEGRDTPCNLDRALRSSNIPAENASSLMDLNTAPFFTAPNPRLTQSVRCEIEEISRILTRHLQGGTVLLTGSFSVSEGRADQRTTPALILSDYDLVAVTPRFADAFPYRVKKKLEEDIQRLRLSTDLDITLVWEPFLKFGVTSTAGSIIAGATRLGPILAAMRPPSARRANVRAHCVLAQAPLDASRYSMLVSKAIVLSARAFLLNRLKNNSRSDWVRLSSVRFLRQAIGDFASLIGCDGVRAVKRSCRELLDMKCQAWTVEEYPQAHDVLNRCGTNLVPTGCWQDWVKHGLWLRQRQLSGVPNAKSGQHALESLQSLCEAWGPARSLDIDELLGASRSAARLCRHSVHPVAANPMGSYRQLMDLVADYIDFYPHKLRWPRGETIRQ